MKLKQEKSSLNIHCISFTLCLKVFSYLFNTYLESYSIFDPKVLKTLFVKGYVNMVVKIIVHLNKTLQKSYPQQVSEYLDLDIIHLMEDV